MKLKPVEKGNYDVYAVEGNSGICELLDYLENIPANLASSRSQLLNIFKLVVEHGPMKLSKERSHWADEDNKIYEFVANRLRVLWFYDEGKLVICSHVFPKTTQKTPKKQSRKAAKLRSRYFEEKERGELEFLEE
jgi:phage-related protein